MEVSLIKSEKKNIVEIYKDVKTGESLKVSVNGCYDWSLENCFLFLERLFIEDFLGYCKFSFFLYMCIGNLLEGFE